MNCANLDYSIPFVRKKWENEENISNVLTKVRVRRTKGSSKKITKPIIQILKPEVPTSSPTEFKNITDKLKIEELTILDHLKNRTRNKLNPKEKSQKVSEPFSNIVKITIVPSSIISLKHNPLKVRETVSKTQGPIKNKSYCLPKRHQEISSFNLFEPSRWKINDELSLTHERKTKTIELNSFNMSKLSRPKRLNKEATQSTKITRNRYETSDLGCCCYDTKINNVLDDMNYGKNRVTIVGSLGINENENYVLNCAATVDNKPITTNFNQQDIDHSPKSDGIDKITRATQADINICYASDKLKQTDTDNKPLCHCKNVKDVATTVSRCKFEDSSDRKDPLIIISVYPTKDTKNNINDLNDVIQINQLQELQQNEKKTNKKSKIMYQKRRNENITVNQSKARSSESRSPVPQFKDEKEKVKNRSLSSRSPSPTLKNVNNYLIEKKFLKSRSRSPTVKPASTENSKSKLIQRATQKSVKTFIPQALPTRINNALPSQRGRLNRELINGNTSQNVKKVYRFKKSNDIEERSVKTNKIKQAIIQDYTQTFLMRENRKKLLGPHTVEGEKSLTINIQQPKTNTSSVTVDIDGDNDKYRLLFLQDALNTDLNICKTLKSHESKKLDESNNNKKCDKKETMEYLSLEAKEMKPENNLEKPHNQWKASQVLRTGFNKNKLPGLTIRDSLEIRHRREDSNDLKKKNFRKVSEPTKKILGKNIKECKDNEGFSASLKHYRGDHCCVPNPNLRDQEIRELLGIKKPRSGRFEFLQEVLPEFRGQKLHYNMHPQKCMRSSSSISYHCYAKIKKTLDKSKNNVKPTFISAYAQFDESDINSYKHVVLNRNIQVFLQVKQFTKQKPIILTRKQYEKVKKTIQKKLSTKSSQDRRRLNNLTKFSAISIGETRKTAKQTTSNEKINRTVQAEKQTLADKQVSKVSDIEKDDSKKSLILLQKKHAEKNNKDDANLNVSPRQIVSSMEVRYASMSHLRHVTFSASNMNSEKPTSSFCREKDSPSIQTIFKGHKKCVTPNLGTSGYSLYSDKEIKSSDYKYTLYPNNEKRKRPFLRRLMSCLVMRSNRASEAILPRQYEYERQSVINSFDSYHISTSLPEVDLTSSLYDTSASFYSNHTVLPIAKMKRGFLSSVRGFLTNLKSR